MNIIVLIILAGVLFIAWLLIPIFIAQYRRRLVYRRYEEIRAEFLRGLPPDKKAVDGPRGKTAAWHYSRLQNPGVAELQDGEADLKAAFHYYHAPKRYSVPCWLIVILSGMMLALIGMWGAMRLLDKSGAPLKNIRIKLTP